MDGLEIVSTANTPKAIKIEVGDEQVTNIPITDYTYSPQSSISAGKWSTGYLELFNGRMTVESRFWCAKNETGVPYTKF